MNVHYPNVSESLISVDGSCTLSAVIHNHKRDDSERIVALPLFMKTQDVPATTRRFDPMLCLRSLLGHSPWHSRQGRYTTWAIKAAPATTTITANCRESRQRALPDDDVGSGGDEFPFEPGAAGLV